eukprot:m.230708 g.230708  ORF g.230708 m.230708 type:complete len:176 (+) comp18126_c0_seq1:104-631(+)
MAAAHSHDPLVDAWARPKNIVVAVDGSHFGEAAMLWALRNMYDEGDVLHLVHCFAPLETVTSLEGGLLTYIPSQTEQDSVADNARKILDEAATKCSSTGPGDKITVKEHLIAGDAGSELCVLADTLHADAVVVGCRGRSALASALLGSVSAYLAHHCKRPLVIVRDPPAPTTKSD